MAARRSKAPAAPSFAEAVHEFGAPLLVELAERGSLTPDRIEQLDDVDLLLGLVDPAVAHTEAVLLHWQPHLEAMQRRESDEPVEDMAALDQLLDSLLVALVGNAGEPGVAEAAERIRKALAAVRQWLPKESRKKHLVASRYDGAVAPKARAGRSQEDGDQPFDASSTSLLLWVLAGAVLIALGANGIRVFKARPQLQEIPLTHYQELVPEVLEKELVGGERMVFTLSNEWANRSDAARTDDALILVEASAIEGWRTFVVQDEGNRLVLRTGTRGEIVVVRGEDGP